MRPVPRFSEDVRQLVHMATGGVALLLRFTSWWQAAVLAAGAVAFNAYALPHIASGWLYRELEGRRRFLSGITLYPIAVLGLILALPDRFDIVAGARSRRQVQRPSSCSAARQERFSAGGAAR
jgi:hypothetical protein